MRIFGGDKIKNLMSFLKIPEDQPIEANLVSKAIEDAQAKVEGMNFDLRKHVLEYDDVLNKHREVIYKKRKEILEKSVKKELSSLILEMVKKAGFSEEEYKKKEKEIGEENMRQVEKIVSLRILDALWVEHLENMEYLRDSVRLRAYGQQDPLVEYKSEGHRMFQRLLETIESNIVRTILGVSLRPAAAKQNYASGSPRPGAHKPDSPKPGRNDPCPCGKINPQTGKPMKYKKCCWPKYG
jgi:preprotein translocase subunit SecA